MISPSQFNSENISPLAGKPAQPNMLIDTSSLITAYHTQIPDPTIKAQRASFGTSGHRGSSLKNTFNEWHILAITQAIVLFRIQHNINGPLFLGIDTHALSTPAFVNALEVLAANNIDVMIAGQDKYTPTPVISHAILCYNHNRQTGLADGIVITPSHNPPYDGGFKYNPPHGGPADQTITQWIEAKANAFLENRLTGVKRISFERALNATTTHSHDFLNNYVNDLDNVIDMRVIHDTNIRIGVDPLGGAGIHYWEPIAERYGLDLTVVNKTIDPTFSFMTLDWDEQIRMDPSSRFAMAKLIALKDQFDIVVACDTDHDRHGIVTPSAGLMPPNHYLAVAIYYLFQHRPQWIKSAAVGKTIVSSQMIDRVTAKLDRELYEVPVGFKWFVNGLLDSSLGFVGEESAGASFLRHNGNVWTTDKDGIVLALLAAEITARMGHNPAELYHELEIEFGTSDYERIDTPATTAQKELLKNLLPQDIQQTELAGEAIQTIMTHATGNNAPIGGLKVATQNGWFAARPSGTEDITKIYAESFKGKDHLQRIVLEAKALIDQALMK